MTQAVQFSMPRSELLRSYRQPSGLARRIALAIAAALIVAGAGTLMHVASEMRMAESGKPSVAFEWWTEGRLLPKPVYADVWDDPEKFHLGSTPYVAPRSLPLQTVHTVGWGLVGLGLSLGVLAWIPRSQRESA